MNVFLLPIKFIDELEKMMNSFWWGTKKPEKGGIAWMRWERLCVHKGGWWYGFSKFNRIQSRNVGQAWVALIAGTQCSRVIKARYFSKGDFLMAKVRYQPSYVWRSLLPKI
ncbi:hypothetical protein LINGRAHAP2_LOCUS5109 [Linum grandiflorum]